MTLTKKRSAARFWAVLERSVQAGDMPALEALVLDYRDDPLAPTLAADPRFAQYAPGTRNLYRTYETADERRVLALLLAQSRPQVAGSEPIERTYAYVPLEVTAAGITAQSQYCHVGCGPLPETLVAVHAATQCVLPTGIDADAAAVADARRAVVRLAPQGQFALWHSAGQHTDYHTFTHMHLAVLVRPETAVVRQMCHTARRDVPVTIMLRTVAGLGGLLYEPLATATLQLLATHRFRHVHTVRGHAIMNTAIFRRNAS